MNGYANPGLTIRHGPVDPQDAEMHDAEVNGAGLSKRKSRGSDMIRKSYAEPESSEEDKPLVRHVFF